VSEEYNFAFLCVQWSAFPLFKLKRNDSLLHYLCVGTPASSGVLIRGEPSPVPMCPSGSILACSEPGRGCASPSPKAGQTYLEGLEVMASPTYYSSMKQSVPFRFSQTSAVATPSSRTGASSVPAVTALSVEFVAKPREAQQVEAAIPAAIAGAFKDVTGFAGCLVMISDQEARLITVVTLWAGADRDKCCTDNVRWIRALLAPYMDRCLRVQKMFAHLPVLPMSPFLPAAQPGISSTDECLISERPVPDEETICVA